MPPHASVSSVEPTEFAASFRLQATRNSSISESIIMKFCMWRILLKFTELRQVTWIEFFYLDQQILKAILQKKKKAYI